MRAVINLSDTSTRNWPWEKPIQHHLWKPEGDIPNDCPHCQQHSLSMSRSGLPKVPFALRH